MTKKQKRLTWMSFGVGLVLLLGLGYFSLQDRSVESVFVGQYSLPKTMLLVVQLGIMLLFVGMHGLLLKDGSALRRWFGQHRLSKDLFSGLSVGVLLLLALLAGIEAMGAQLWLWGTYSKLFYLIFSLVIVGIDFLFVWLLFAGTEGLEWQTNGWLLSTGIAMGVLGVFVLSAKLFGFLTIQETYLWSETGNPLLFLQVVVGVLLMLLVKWGIDRLGVNRRLMGILLPIVLIGVACLVWDWQLDLHSRFYLHPAAPNWDFYPNWDAQTFDLRSEYIRYGYGYEGSKEMMPFLLNVYRLFVGNAYERFLIPQMILMLLLPVGIFYLGKLLWNETLGFLAALLVIFQQKNGFTFSYLMPNINLHALMSEVPTLLLLVWASVFLVLFLKRSKIFYGLISSTLFFLASLTRLNVLVSFVFVALMLGVYFVWQNRTAIKQYVWFGLNYVILFVGWQVYRFIVTGDLIFYSKIQAVIFRFLGFHREVPAGSAPISTATIPAPIVAPTAAPDVVMDGSGSAGILFSSINHLLNSIVRSFLVLPSKLAVFWRVDKAFLDIDLWSADWDFGVISGGMWVVFALNAILVVGGIVFLWKKRGWSGIVPLMVFAGYVLSLGAAQTSGGRYVYPIDWVMIFYYAVGLVCLIKGLFSTFFDVRWKEQEEKLQRHDNFAKGGYVALILFIGLMMMMPKLGLGKFKLDKEERMDHLEAAFEQYGKDADWVNAWLAEDPGHYVLSGVALYPYLYAEDQFYMDLQTYDDEVLYVRLVSNGPNRIYVPLSEGTAPPKLPHDTEIIALAVAGEKTVIKAYVFWDEGEWYLYEGDVENVEELMNAEF